MGVASVTSYMLNVCSIYHSRAGGGKANKRGPALVDDSKYCGGGIGRRKGNGN